MKSNSFQKALNVFIPCFLILVAAWTSIFAQIKHKFILADGELGKILLVDQFNPANNWDLTLTGKNCDFQLVGNNRLMVTFEYGTSSETGGFQEIDITTGKVVRKCLNLVAKAHGMSARRLPNGNTIFCGDTLIPGLKGIAIVQMDSTNSTVIRKFSYPGYMGPRLMRRTPMGTFLFGANTSHICEGDSTGKIIWDKAVPGGDDVYKASRLKNGNTLVSSGYGATIVEFNPSGTVVKTYGGLNQPQAATILPYFYGCFQVLSNGHIVLTNWQGHFTNLKGQGIQVLEYDTTGQMVWYWEDSTRYSSLHTVIVIDSLDTKYLYDDRNGGVLQTDPLTVAINYTPGYQVNNHERNALQQAGINWPCNYFDLQGRLVLRKQEAFKSVTVLRNGIYLNDGDGRQQAHIRN